MNVSSKLIKERIVAIIRITIFMLEICFVYLNKDLTAFQYQHLSSFVSEQKRKRIERFIHFDDSQRTLIGDVLARFMIHKHGMIKFDKINFIYNDYGKPLINENVCQFDFNLSHAGRFVVCAFSDSQVGIDIEIIRGLDLNIAQRFFANDEIQYIQDSRDNERINTFFDLWTMKEAYIKYRGMGLSLPLDSFSVFDIKILSLFKCAYRNKGAVCHVCSNQELTNIVFMDINKLLEHVSLIKYP